MSGPGNDHLRLEWRPFHFQLPHALITAHGALGERRGWLLRLSRADGAVGWGEAAPWPGAPDQRQASVGPGRPPALAQPPVLALPQSQLTALALTIAQLGPVLRRQELEASLPALPACLGFALGLALAELDGLGAPSPEDPGWAGPVEGDPSPRAYGESVGAAPDGRQGQRRCREGGSVGLSPWAPSPARTGFSNSRAGEHRSRTCTPADPGSSELYGAPSAGSDQDWRGPWRAAPPSAWLLPAGEAALAALETLLASAEQLQGRETSVGSAGHLGAAGAMPPGAGGVTADPGAVGGAFDLAAQPADAWRGTPQASGRLTIKWKVATEPDPEERAVLEQLLARLPHGSRLRLDANGGWDRATAQAWAERLASDPRLEWLEQPLAPSDLDGLTALAALIPVALDESLRLDPGLRDRWPGWQVRRPSLEGDPRPLLRALTSGTPMVMLSTAFETGIGRRFLAHLAALQQDGPTPTAPGLAPGWRPAGALFANDPALVWAAAADGR